jgi:drug/metabolite transporter (DMT)-like permease
MNGNRLKIILAFAAVYIIWGSTYFAVRFGIETIPPFLISGLRFFAAGIILFVYCLNKEKKLPGRKSIFINSICGILMLGGGTVTIAWSEQYVPSSIAAIIVSFSPFWFVLMDKRQWNFYFSEKTILAGLVLGFAGVMLLTFFSSTDTSGVSKPNHAAFGIIAILAGGITWTIGSLYSKYTVLKSSWVMNTSIQLIATALACFVVSFFVGELTTFSLRQVSIQSWMALLYLIFMGSLVAYTSYIFLLNELPAAQVSTYVYVNPLVAVLLGVAFANERISFTEVIALFIILCGVLLVNISKYNGLKKST